jgi:hypothetical protein
MKCPMVISSRVSDAYTLLPNNKIGDIFLPPPGRPVRSEVYPPPHYKIAIHIMEFRLWNLSRNLTISTREERQHNYVQSPEDSRRTASWNVALNTDASEHKKRPTSIYVITKFWVSTGWNYGWKRIIFGGALSFNLAPILGKLS